MGRSASEKRILELQNQLASEQTKHAKTRNELQQEIARIWRLVPGYYINLMGVYPPLRRLLHVLAEAADLQDPSRGAPVEDTMRTQFVHTGENASASMTESAAEHSYYRTRVRGFSKDLRVLADDVQGYVEKKLADDAHRFGQSLGISEWEYPEPPKCQRTTCPKRNRKQPFSAWQTGCVGCGRSLAEKVS